MKPAGQPSMTGFTIVEIMVVFAILSIISAIAMTRYQQYTYRAKAAAVTVQADPIRRAIQEHYNTMDVAKYRLELYNAADGSIAGCQVLHGGACTGPSETIVAADKLLIANGTVRVLAGLCQVDCPSYALAFTSDIASTGGTNPSAAGAPSTASGAPAAGGGAPSAGGSTPASGGATPAPGGTTPASGTGAPATGGGVPSTGSGAASGKGKGGGKGQGSGKGGNSSLYLPLISSAYAQSGTSNLEMTNRVLYEFGELMRARVHASNNANCVQATGTCTVTLKYP